MAAPPPLVIPHALAQHATLLIPETRSNGKGEHSHVCLGCGEWTGFCRHDAMVGWWTKPPAVKLVYEGPYSEDDDDQEVIYMCDGCASKTDYKEVRLLGGTFTADYVSRMND